MDTSGLGVNDPELVRGRSDALCWWENSLLTVTYQPVCTCTCTFATLIKKYLVNLRVAPMIATLKVFKGGLPAYTILLST